MEIFRDGRRWVCRGLAACWLWALTGVAVAADVRINEFLASNGGGLTDEDGDSEDWMELRNMTGVAIDLAEWSLTDDADSPRKWEFPSTIIQPGGQVVVFASGKNRTSPRLHTNFSLDAAGEYLALVRPDGRIEHEFAPVYEEQRRNISYGYNVAGTSLVFFTTPTPGTPNAAGVADFVKDVNFSHSRGFFDQAFDLTLSSETAGATIRYTLNGSAPTATTGTIYTGPIPIRVTTVIRAAAFAVNLQPTPVETETYFFVDDIIRQCPTGQAPTGWPASWGANTVDYGMDPDVVNNPLYSGTIRNDLKSLPSISIVVNLPDLFNSTTGIYANPGNDGRAWERPCSVELIHPDGKEGFQINAGLRIRGGFSRSTSNPKHAFRLFFREEYGAGKLVYPMFGNRGTDTFDGIDLRTFQNYSWSFQGDSTGIFMRDQFSRDTQEDMGHNAERGEYYHLYINGQYWGIFNSCERPEASYAESYHGGSKEDYDVVKVEPYTVVATDGTMAAWTSLYNQVKTGVTTASAYQRLLGNNPDGTPNTSYPVLVDLPNLIDYMLVIIYAGNKDAPISNFLGNSSPNNWFGFRNRRIEARQGFQFFAHDAEHTLLVGDLNIDRTGPWPAGDSSVATSSPQWIFQRLWANAEFKLTVADHVHRHFFNGGLLTPEKNRERLMRRKNEIDRAVVAESARWGDAKRTSPLTRSDWQNAVNAVLNNYFPQRSGIVLNQLRAKGLYPNIVAPTFSQHGGPINAGFSLTMTAPSGDIYYTLDESDPRLMGGALSPAARRYTGAVPLSESTLVKARVRTAGQEWSALNEASFIVTQTFRELLVTEIMYNPVGGPGVDGETFEFLELKNVGSATLDLSGVRLTNGVSYRFPNGTRLSAGGFAVLVGDPAAFAARYPGVRIDGVYTNRLSNSGERLALVHATGTVIQQFTFSDQPPWPPSADGAGFSLVPRVLNPNADYSDAAHWRASSRPNGSPGADDPLLEIPAVVVNEVLTHTDLPQLDAIELHNPGSTAADISGWFLTDDPSVPKKFRIPAGTGLPAFGYVVFDERQFNPTPGTDPSFNLSSHGESVHLYSADGAGNLTGYAEGFSFRAAENGVSFGRQTNSAGEVLHPPQQAVTLGAANAGPRVGPVVINEIRYAPTAGDEEYIELKNITSSPVKLFDEARPANTWRIEGVSFVFPTGAEIPAQGLALVTATDPAAFRARYSVAATVPVLGPFPGALQDNGELLVLERPDAPDEGPGGMTIIPYLTVDMVRYNDREPWPVAAASGFALEKIRAEDFGNDPASWRASPGDPSPGLPNDGNRRPFIDAGDDLSFVSAAFPYVATLTATVRDDGLPVPPGRLTVTWRMVSAPGEVLIDQPNLTNAVLRFPGTGTYVVRATVSDGAIEASDEVTVTIARPLSEVELVAAGSLWKYLDNGSNQGTAWRQPTFADAAWREGRAQLGYGDGDETTTLGFGPDSGAKYVTAYFRRRFNVADARSILSATVHLMRDDGGAVYLNGQPVFIDNLPETFAYQTYAPTVIGGAEESTFYTREIDPALLLEGENVLAVEIHQANAGSSDVSFDLKLTALANFSNQPPTANAGPDATVTLPAPLTLNGTAGDDGLPNPPGVFSALWARTIGPDDVEFDNPNSLRTTVRFKAPGVYVLRLSVTDGQLSARDDLQVEVKGGDAYTAWKEQHFTPAELNDPALSGDLADPDLDGFTNQQEFTAGTRPKDAASYLHVGAVQRENGSTALQFEAVGDKGYSVELRDSLNDGAWERLLNLAPQGTTQTIEVLDASPAAATRFYRLVTPALPLEPEG